MNTYEIRELDQLLADLWDEDNVNLPEDVNVFVKRMNRQYRKRCKTSREYPGNLHVLADRHAIENAERSRMRRLLAKQNRQELMLAE